MGGHGPTRRQFLGTLTAAGSLGLSGCSGVRRAVGLPTRIDEETREQSVDLATQTASDLEAWRRERVGTARLLAQSDPLRNGTTDERHRYVDEAAALLPDDIHHLHLVDRRDWTIVGTSNPAKVDEPLTTHEAPWRGDSIEYGENGVFVSEATYALGWSLLSLVSPVRAGDESQLLLVVQITLDKVADSVGWPFSGVYIEVVDDDGRIVADTRWWHVDFRSELPRYPGGADAPPVRAALAGQSGFEADPAVNENDRRHSEPYVAAYTPVETRDWAVLVLIPRATASRL
jgi:hypothetical protein